MTDVQDTTFDTDDVDDATDALMKKWDVSEEPAKPAPDQPKPPSAKAVERAAAEETDDSDDVELDGEEGEEGESEEKSKDEVKALAADDHEVEVQVDGEARRVKVADLKRLYGQEASLTRKSQEVAAARQQADEVSQRHTTALTSLLERAKERYEPFAKIDFMVAQTQLDPEEFAQLRQMAAAAKADMDFFSQELDKGVQVHKENYQKATAEAATACVQALTNPETGIKGFGPEMYKEICDYGVSQGGKAEIIGSITDPVAIKLIHKAMLYDRARAKAATKIAKAPKNVNRAPQNNDAGQAQRGVASKAMDKLRSSGDPEDAADALMARWASSGE